MNSIVLLCGGNDAGKTTTLRKFFAGCPVQRRERMNFYTRKLGNRIVYGVGDDSPQEFQQLKTKTLCDVDWVKENIKKRIRLCGVEAKGQSFILIIPYGMYENLDRTELNEDCFLQPIEWLKTEIGFKVFPIYLRKTNATHSAKKDELARKVCLKEIDTTRDDFDKSEELEKFIIDFILT
ncbi:MAG: hypothetical protein IMZ53_03210 [Thermoplasmata archaeon]|nr:hypothetical protein [Thermoplasmata archaeon]